MKQSWIAGEKSNFGSVSSRGNVRGSFKSVAVTLCAMFVILAKVVILETAVILAIVATLAIPAMVVSSTPAWNAVIPWTVIPVSMTDTSLGQNLASQVIRSTTPPPLLITMVLCVGRLVRTQDQGVHRCRPLGPPQTINNIADSLLQRQMDTIRTVITLTRSLTPSLHLTTPDQPRPSIHTPRTLGGGLLIKMVARFQRASTRPSI